MRLVLLCFFVFCQPVSPQLLAINHFGTIWYTVISNFMPSFSCNFSRQRRSVPSVRRVCKSFCRRFDNPTLEILEFPTRQPKTSQKCRKSMTSSEGVLLLHPGCVENAKKAAGDTQKVVHQVVSFTAYMIHLGTKCEAQLRESDLQRSKVQVKCASLQWR